MKFSLFSQLGQTDTPLHRRAIKYWWGLYINLPGCVNDLEKIDARLIL
jgi:hypothetical protein